MSTMPAYELDLDPVARSIDMAPMACSEDFTDAECLEIEAVMASPFEQCHTSDDVFVMLAKRAHSP
ncbi:MAG: hypothetical protein FWD73_10255 [Polyangiaceae bacterium]|nr:hypothetical protein [Polyangiaceae bacterium]